MIHIKAIGVMPSLHIFTKVIGITSILYQSYRYYAILTICITPSLQIFTKAIGITPSLQIFTKARGITPSLPKL